MFKLLVTGSREDPDLMMQDRIKFTLGYVAYKLCPVEGTLLQGEATGVDTFASSVWCSISPLHTTVGFPYPSELGRSGGGIRNQAMVDLKPDLVLGFPISSSVGTWDCINRARNAHIPTLVLKEYNDIKVFQTVVNSMAQRMGV